MKNILRNLGPVLILLLSAGTLLFAVWHLLDTKREYKKGEDTYRQIENEYVNRPVGDSENPPKISDEETGDCRLRFDFEGIQIMNPDIIGWIDIPGAGISYPLVQGDDNNYYLTHMSSGEYGIHGSIFMDAHNNPDFTDGNTIIYGHNMKDGTMFAALDAYQAPALFQQYPYFYIYLPGCTLEYQIFSCYYGRTGSIGYTYGFGREETFKDFLESISAYAAYDTNINVSITDRIVTLSTCVNTDRNYRYLIHGKEVGKIKENEHD